MNLNAFALHMNKVNVKLQRKEECICEQTSELLEFIVKLRHFNI